MKKEQKNNRKEGRKGGRKRRKSKLNILHNEFFNRKFIKKCPIDPQGRVDGQKVERLFPCLPANYFVLLDLQKQFNN